MESIYELIKKNATGKGEGMMWKSTAIISDAIEKNMPAEAQKELYDDLYGLMSGGHYNECMAKADVEKMYFEDAKGEVHHAPYWTDAQIRETYEVHKDKIPEYNCWDYYVVFNMIASDNWVMYHTWWPDITPEVFAQKVAEASVNWLADQDWAETDKIWSYLHK